MRALKIVAAVVAAALAFSPMNVSAGRVSPPPHAAGSGSSALGVWLIFGCASGIILAAAIANARDNRQLSKSEAITCGLLFWLNSQQRRPR